MRLLSILPLAFLLVACGDDDGSVVGDGGGDTGPPPGPCTPMARACNGDQSLICRADGTGYDNGPLCNTAAGESCNPLSGSCVNLCAAAASTRSYIGCEYWPTTTLNSSLDPEFEFAVVVANPQGVAAQVTIDRGGANVRTVTVPPSGIETVRLPWVDGLRVPSQTVYASTLVRDGAYRLRSSVPVTVFQFNPLDYRITQDCASETAAGFEPDSQCFSFTNDASLLLPTTALTGNYMFVTTGTQSTIRTEGREMLQTPSQGFATIVGTQDGTRVEVALRSDVLSSEDETTVQYGTAGTTVTYMLDAGDVLELTSAIPDGCPPGSPHEPCSEGMGCSDIAYCSPIRETDLTGSVVRASAPVSVIAGHDCAFMPFQRFACDHLEETMHPVETWGKELVVTLTEQLRGEPNIVRVVSGTNGNMVTFDPPVAAATTINQGDFLEFETTQSFVVRGTQPLLVGHFLVGQDYQGLGAGEGGLGDPSLSLGVPREQFRSDYTFLAPSNYEQNYVNVIAPTGAQIMLDGQPLEATFTAIGGSGLSNAKVRLAGDATSPGTGRHDISSTVPIGVIVYGYGQYTSYMYPGGLNLEMIAAPF